MKLNKWEMREAAAEFAALSRREQKEPLFTKADRERMNSLRASLIANGAF